MLKNLPSTPDAILEMEWVDYEPHFKSLQSTQLTSENVNDWLLGWSALADRLDEQYTRLFVATTQFTNDEGIEKRFNHFVESIQPQARTEEQKLKEKLLASSLQPDNFKMGLKKMRAEADIFREENLELLVEEQKLNAEYNKNLGSQTVLWEGEERTASQMYSLLFEKDRAVREKAWRAGVDVRLKNRDAINDLWKKFMAVRIKIAQNAGLSDYRAYAWAQKFRFDYSPEDCKTFHKAIEEVVVPAAKRIFEKRRHKLGLESVRPWDQEVDTSNESPLKPYQTVEELKSKARDIFTKVDPKFGEYFQTMLDENLLDLDSRKNKAPGGYNLIYGVSKRPFIFMNNTGTHDDVVTLLHEGGHAFHAFEAGVVPYFHERSENYVPAEFAEVASMAMELLASPYITKEHGGYYTEGEAARAQLEHLEGIITMLPYLTLVDAFQHWIYENPQDGSDPILCENQWGELWDRFIPYVDYSGLEDAKKTVWHRQLHIHTLPFYYIEYALAELGAVQVWANALKDQKQAVENYRKALALGSTVSLPELFEAAGAKFSFDAKTLKIYVDLLEEQIEKLEQVKS
ncbi:MAG: M3 family oligoendopeptidase [Anaerolineales bacterium]|nr:M3 family oligoendopeptidase [Anaerolineales bacterium]